MVTIAIWLLMLVAGCAEQPTQSPTRYGAAPVAPPATEAEATAVPAPSPTAFAEPAPAEPTARRLSRPLYVAIIWHQHQPVYLRIRRPGSMTSRGSGVHAAKDYVDMAAMLAGYPEVHATFNLTPSLLRQVIDLAAGARDRYWVMTEIPADQLSDEDKSFLRDRFFDTNPKIIARFPRYQELATDRENSDAWDEGTWRDLQVLFNLAWTDPDWLAREPLQSLVAKGRDFDEADKTTVLAEHQRLVEEVIPVHRRLQEGGQIQVTMTP